MRITDLPDLSRTIDDRGVYHPPPFLYCEVCQGEYSAHRGDYWAVAPEGEIACCGEPCQLVKRETRLIPVDLSVRPVSTT